MLNKKENEIEKEKSWKKNKRRTNLETSEPYRSFRFGYYEGLWRAEKKATQNEIKFLEELNWILQDILTKETKKIIQERLSKLKEKE